MIDMRRGEQRISSKDIKSPAERLIAAKLLLDAYPDEREFEQRFGRPRSQLVAEVWNLQKIVDASRKGRS